MVQGLLRLFLCLLQKCIFWCISLREVRIHHKDVVYLDLILVFLIGNICILFRGFCLWYLLDCYIFQELVRRDKGMLQGMRGIFLILI